MFEDLTTKLIYGTPYIHTGIVLVRRGIKTLKDIMRTNLADNCNLNEVLYWSLTLMRTTVHSKMKETQFERKSRMELINYLNLPSNVIPARPETLQIYSFASKTGTMTNWG